MGKQLQWDVYHIENYLLDSQYIALALNEMLSPSTNFNAKLVERHLCAAAEKTKHSLIEHEIRKLVNEKLTGCLNFQIDPSRTDSAAALREAIDRSVNRINTAANTDYALEKLIEHEHNIALRLQGDLEGGNWRRTFKGRDILKEFTRTHGKGVRYQHFRNLLVARMKADGHQPEGMKRVIGTVFNTVV
ncbi:MAG TPA: hypothetical protein PKA33_11605 [Amaricoccus sp.]|uniref:hypothetical protein n=1 Tax=Amaricoccus sp. TaxID=1872485 RepID=UPI002CB6D460|nr:hypothetical protein [Amaricoccus sp.]HMQ93207.1 hypothetical protein [Amaricoccus sp.]HMR53052.1 hypothetical protein [Amaricoccus sp.]HMR61309.1 hypothetical protein [Amaricoccus sp.]HMT99995.1 hypothetical protein [Amaricoccus sp.]